MTCVDRTPPSSRCLLVGARLRLRACYCSSKSFASSAPEMQPVEWSQPQGNPRLKFVNLHCN